MARKPKKAEPNAFDELVKGMEAKAGPKEPEDDEEEPEDDEPEDDEPEDEEEATIKIIEPPPPAKRHGITVEDYDVPAVTGAKPAENAALPDDQREPDFSHLSPSARDRLNEEMNAGKEQAIKLRGGG